MKMQCDGFPAQCRLFAVCGGYNTEQARLIRGGAGQAAAGRATYDSRDRSFSTPRAHLCARAPAKLDAPPQIRHSLPLGRRLRCISNSCPPSLLACSSLRKPRLRQREFVCACPRRLHIRHPAAGSNIIRSQSQHLCLTKRLLAISLIAHAVLSGVALRGIHATCSPQNGIHAILPPSDFAFREVKSGFVGSIVRA